MKRIAILASGSGSNAEAIMDYFKDHPDIRVVLVMSNRRKAYVLERAARHGISHFSFDRDFLNSEAEFLSMLEDFDIDYLILAGFLLLVPGYLTRAYHNRILNIHPALLPKYGGKGMYGHHVHQAVFDNKDKETGMTIHLVNEKYDEGKILFQDKLRIDAADTADTIASKVLELEHRHYPRVIEEYITRHSRVSRHHSQDS